MRYLSDIEVKSLLENKWLQIIEAIESAFLDSTAEMIPKTYLNGWGGDFRAMPAALGDYAALKWISVFPSNWQKEKHTIHGTLVLSDRRTGETLIAMDCRTLTAYRTAATSAIAAKYCAPKAEEFAFIGCGLQAKYHIEAYESIFSHMKMSVELYDKNEKAQKDLFDWISEENIARAWGRNKSVKQAVQHADVVTTLTPSTEGYLDILDLKSNCHINAVGADAVGKRELMPNVIDGAGLIVCDDEEQALHSGELQYNVWPNSSLELYSLTSVIKKYTRASKQISVFDSTGVAIEDVAIANFIYNELL
tara:strand:- start:202 stop:1122 length:921 start_codon:yes stop_codon:yes gene_type:complete